MVKEGPGKDFEAKYFPIHFLTSLKVLVSGAKPSAPGWAGIGDFDVVRIIIINFIKLEEVNFLRKTSS